jgi:hypothetical protein
MGHHCQALWSWNLLRDWTQAMACFGLLLLFGLLTPDEAISGLSNPAVLMVPI